MTRTLAPLILLGLLVAGSKGAYADPIQIPLPLESPVSVNLSLNPIVTFGTRTIDFTDNLDQEFIAFLIAQRPVGRDYRSTIGLRARDGLRRLGGMFPPSPDPTFENQLPTFAVGTMDLIAFDLIVAGCCERYSVSLVDLHGDQRVAGFSNPIPEPSSLLLAASGLALAARARRRRTG
jgi:hypothetical protein